MFTALLKKIQFVRKFILEFHSNSSNTDALGLSVRSADKQKRQYLTIWNETQKSSFLQIGLMNLSVMQL